MHTKNHHRHQFVGLQIAVLSFVLTAGVSVARAQTAPARAVPFGLNPDQVRQINASAQASPELENLNAALTAAQRDAVATALDTNATEAVVRRKVETVARIQMDIAMLRYRNGVKPLAPAVTEAQKTILLASPEAGYRQLFVSPFAIEARGGVFVPRVNPDR